MSPAQLDRKEELCRELLEVAAKLDRGMSRFRALLLYDLHEVLARRGGVERMREAVRALRESLGIISADPAVTEEGQLTSVAKRKLAALQEQLRRMEGGLEGGSEGRKK